MYTSYARKDDSSTRVGKRRAVPSNSECRMDRIVVGIETAGTEGECWDSDEARWWMRRASEVGERACIDSVCMNGVVEDCMVQ